MHVTHECTRAHTDTHQNAVTAMERPCFHWTLFLTSRVIYLLEVLELDNLYMNLSFTSISLQAWLSYLTSWLVFPYL